MPVVDGEDRLLGLLIVDDAMRILDAEESDRLRSEFDVPLRRGQRAGGEHRVDQRFELDEVCRCHVAACVAFTHLLGSPDGRQPPPGPVPAATGSTSRCGAGPAPLPSPTGASWR